MKKLIFLFIALVCFPLLPQAVVNTKHLDYLYEERQLGGTDLGFVHIYADAPDYKYVEATKEGISCTDDVARAAVLYGMLYGKNPSEKLYKKIANLSRYLLYVQNQNGFYNNFIYEDGTVNTIFKTSVAEPDWWSWRAIWSLANVYEIIAAKDEALSNRIRESLQRAIQVSLPRYVKTNEFKTIQGFSVPQWLPAEGGSDQAAVLVKGLVKYYKLFADSSVLPVISSLCDGILSMQVTDTSSEMKGAFLSWQNTWHSWGNNQSDALLDAYEITHDSRCLNAALFEITNFYPWVQKSGYLLGIVALKEDNHVLIRDKEQYSQIAYGIRPMIFACLHANRITGEEKYLQQALEYAGWFFGENPVGRMMYSTTTGRCYDGINSASSVNLNSGAESTIEALLSLAALDAAPGGHQTLIKKYRLH